MTLQERIDRGLWWDIGLGLVQGCTPVKDRPACDNCWSAAASHMREKNPNPKIADRYRGLTTSKGKFNGQIRLMWDDLNGVRYEHNKRRFHVYAVWNDLFHEKVSDEEILHFFRQARGFPGHRFVLCTKRHDRARELMPGIWEEVNFGSPLPNAIGMVTAEDQFIANEVGETLLSTPWACRVLNVEPMLSWVVPPRRKGLPLLDGLIIGCESGPNRRKLGEEGTSGMENTIWYCGRVGIPIFIKQIELNGKVSKNLAEWPEKLQVRELPEAFRTGGAGE